MRSVLKPILIGLLITPFAYAIGGLYSGGGHSLMAITLFFPWAITASYLFPNANSFLDLSLIALQFPLYAVSLSILGKNQIKFFLVLGILTLIHACVVGWAFASDPRQDWRILLR